MTQYDMEEKLESLLKHDRMAGEMSMTERLMRQKNTILQRQLDVNLQILDREGRSSQKHLEHLIDEYSVILSELPSRWSGLDTYTQPNTRAMRTNNSLRDRRMSLQPRDDTVRTALQHRPHTVTPRQSTPVSPTYHQRSPPPKEQPKFTTCLEVLDDIINNHSLRKKPNRHRRIGLVMPTPGRPGDVLPSACSTSQLDGHGEDNVRPVRIRPNSSYVSSRTAGTDIHGPVRPHTAHALRSSVRASTPRRSTPRGETPMRPCSAAARPRPKSAPPKYELYGRSPAVPRRTVAGIMAEMHSRRAATRDMIGKSKQLHNYIASLAWADI